MKTFVKKQVMKRLLAKIIKSKRSHKNKNENYKLYYVQ